MDFRILGPLEACDERGEVPLGGIRQRALLALLVVHANETLSGDRLVEELWGERAPAAPAKTLQMHVSRLRRVLGGDPTAALVTRDRGYELRVEPDRIDAHRFERLAARGREELGAGDPRRAAATLEQALDLWRGRVLADLADEPFAQPEIARLEDLRIAALEQLMEARLQLGADADLVAALEALIAEHPYRERLRAQLMLALYRADRQADALQAYQDTRRRLVDELGIEPGERLRELERAILAQDPALALPVAPPAPPTPGSAAPPAADLDELPSGVVTFLLTDIEGSSALWEGSPEPMAVALERHDELIAEVTARHGGRVLKAKGEGDSTLTVFRRASDGVEAAAELAPALAAQGWPGEIALRVRIAVHTGEAHERDGDYFGTTLNRAARLRTLAAGGEIVLSQATTEIVRDRLPPGAELADRGDHVLPGLTRPERVFTLRPAAAAAADRPAAPQEPQDRDRRLRQPRRRGRGGARPRGPPASHVALPDPAARRSRAPRRHRRGVPRATSSWPPSACRSFTRTTRCGRYGPLPACARRSPGSPPISRAISARARRCAPGSARGRWSATRPMRAVRRSTPPGGSSRWRRRARSCSTRRPGGSLGGGDHRAGGRAYRPRGRRGRHPPPRRRRRGARGPAVPVRRRRSSAASSRSRRCSGVFGARRASAPATCPPSSAPRASASRGWSSSSSPASAARPTVLRGRCLSYGEGITYWPLAELVARPRARRTTPGEPLLDLGRLGERRAPTAS